MSEYISVCMCILKSIPAVFSSSLSPPTFLLLPSEDALPVSNSACLFFSTLFDRPFPSCSIETDSMIRVGGDYQAQIPEFKPGKEGEGS